MGSGTALVAAQELGRKCIGIEIEQKYCDIAIERLKQGVFKWPEKGEFDKMEPIYVSCPFCGEDDFDLIGLKYHLISGYCETYESTEVSGRPRISDLIEMKV